MKIKARKANIKIYIIPFIIITLIFVMIIYTMGKSIRNYFYDLKREEALKISNSIFIDLSHTGEAYDIINKLLEDKLESALIVAQDYRENFDDDFLSELVNIFEIDELSTYNSQGIIEFSSSGQHIGWRAYEGHPVYNFMTSNENILIEEDIRRDTVNDLYYKFGYIKHPNGEFIQIGIMAEKVNDLLGPVRLQHHLEEMVVDDSIIQLFALDNDFIITASVNQDILGSQITNESIISHIRNGKIYEDINSTNGQEFFEIFVPLENEVNDILGFGVQYSLNEVLPVLRNNTLISLAGVLIVYVSLLYSLFTTYKRNKKLIQLAYYDDLTGLPNMELLKQRLDDDQVKSNSNKAIIMINCDNLNFINLTYGYEFGNLLLKELGLRINALENKNIKLFRLSEGKFILYINQYSKKDDLMIIINQINELLGDSFVVNNTKVHLVIKIGVLELNHIDSSLDDLLKKTTIALRYVDRSKTGNYSFFNETMELDVKREEIIERELIDAIHNGGRSKVYLAYQPIVDSKTKKIDSFEALARMNSEEFGFVSPIEFIDIAERKQLIIPLSNLIIREGSIFIKELVKSGYEDMRVAINISTIHLIQEDFVDTVLDIIKETGIKGKNLELELTETIFMDNFQIVNDRLRELRASGIHISIDDFGTGYSSFERLKKLYVDTLKIDKFFIDNIVDKNIDSVIIREIIAIAHGLGLETVAEGVEHHEQKEFLTRHDCDRLQGYLFSKPVSDKEAIELLKEYNYK